MSDTGLLPAVVGLGLRLPGATTPAELWSALAGRVDRVGPVPEDRWSAAELRRVAPDVPPFGAFLDDVRGFDADFFSISPREARAMDPQQRLALEVAWETLEDGGQPVREVAARRTAVVVGASWHDYDTIAAEAGSELTAHSLVGTVLDSIAARISYAFGFGGPSLAMETGCSSSLVALDHAARLLRHGEIDDALVLGVNLMLHPRNTVGLTRFGGLSPTGRCHSFGEDADGFVRGEGVVAVHLRRYADALRDHDRVRGLVLSTAVNNDGGGDSLVTPSSAAQERLLRAIYDERASVDDLAYVEAHGTGTRVGDVAEARALGSVLGRRRTAPLPIGSAKTNFGHLEPAAGLLGLAKALLVLEKRCLPPSLHSEVLRADIDFDDLNLAVVRAATELPPGAGTVGVSSFGWGGTNAHVLVADPTHIASTAAVPSAPDASEPAVAPSRLVPVSAGDGPALRDRLESVVGAEREGVDPAALDAALARRRAHLAERAVVHLGPGDSLGTTLAQGDPERVVRGRALPVTGVAFVFPGQGAQWEAMGRLLHREDLVFRTAFEECHEALVEAIGWGPAEALRDESARWLHEVDQVQPFSWAMAVSLGAVLRHRGVVPDVVIGHSQGEIAAAVVAGHLSVAAGARVVGRRSQLVRRHRGGRMLWVAAGEHEVDEVVSASGGEVSVAAVNGPGSCVLAGSAEAVAEVTDRLGRNGVTVKQVDVDYAAHTSQMDAPAAELAADLADLAVEPGASIEMWSTVRGRLVVPGETDAAYWAANLREPVRMAEGLAGLLGRDVSHFVEVSTAPVLTGAVQECARAAGRRVSAVPVLERGSDGRVALERALGRLYVDGLDVFADVARRPPVDLPRYPWQHRPYWLERNDAGERAQANAPTWRLRDSVTDPGRRTDEVRVATEVLPWLEDHRVGGRAVVPGALWLSWVLTALQPTPGEAVTLHGVRIEQSLPVATAGSDVSLVVDDGPASTTSWSVRSSGRTASVLARGTAELLPRRAGSVGGPSALSPDPSLDVGTLYDALAASGIEYGDAFRVLRSAVVGDDVVEAVVRLDERWTSEAARIAPHPLLLDGAFQGIHLLLGGAEALVPVGAGRVVFAPSDGEPATEWLVRVTRTGSATVDITVRTVAGDVLLEVDGLRVAALGADLPAPDVLATWRQEEVAVEADADSGSGSHEASGPRGEARVLVLDAALAAQVAAASEEPVRVLDRSPDPAESVMTLLHALRRADGDGCGEVVLVTSGARGEHADPDPVGAALWAAARVFDREHPGLVVRLVDVAPLAPAGVVRSALRHTDADQVLAGPSGVVRLELRRGGPSARNKVRRPRGDDPFVLRATGAGRVEPTLPDRPGSGDPLGPRGVRVQVRYAGLNFIDVLKMVGGYPDPAFRDLLGNECAGVVVAVGEEVTAVGIGDRVVAAAPGGALASHVTVDERLLAPIRGSQDEARAGGSPVALLTAWHALADLAQVRPGQTVLVHSAAGGLGLACVQVARRRGPE